MSDYANKFMWYELMTSDVKEAEAFYTDLIGWKTVPWDGDKEPYIMWTIDGQPVGGLMALPDEAKALGVPPHWLGYVGTDDVDATSQKALSLGATTLLPPTDISDVGRISIIKDPQGATIALFTPKENDNVYCGEPQTGRVKWHELITTDQDSAWLFYKQLFGWEILDAMDIGPNGTYQIIGYQGKVLGGIMTLPSDAFGPPNWSYYITVNDINAAIETVKTKGGKLLNGPMTTPDGDQVAQFFDDQGAAFSLHCVC